MSKIFVTLKLRLHLSGGDGADQTYLPGLGLIDKIAEAML
jgi:hypothetical protein